MSYRCRTKLENFMCRFTYSLCSFSSPHSFFHTLLYMKSVLEKKRVSLHIYYMLCSCIYYYLIHPTWLTAFQKLHENWRLVRSYLGLCRYHMREIRWELKSFDAKAMLFPQMGYSEKWVSKGERKGPIFFNGVEVEGMVLSRSVELLCEFLFFVCMCTCMYVTIGSPSASVNGEVQNFLFTIPWSGFAKQK